MIKKPPGENLLTEEFYDNFVGNAGFSLIKRNKEDQDNLMRGKVFMGAEKESFTKVLHLNAEIVPYIMSDILFKLMPDGFSGPDGEIFRFLPYTINQMKSRKCQQDPTLVKGGNAGNNHGAFMEFIKKENLKKKNILNFQYRIRKNTKNQLLV